MISLSTAMRRPGMLPCLPPYFNGIHSCPLGVAYVGTLTDREAAELWSFLRTLSYSSVCEFMLRQIMRAFPHLGSTVRAWPSLAAALEAAGQLPSYRRLQSVYRLAPHKSLWSAITDL
jgi:hypothetical protein